MLHNETVVIVIQETVYKENCTRCRVIGIAISLDYGSRDIIGIIEFAREDRGKILKFRLYNFCMNNYDDKSIYL